MKRLIPMAIVLMLGMSSVARAEFYVGASYLSTDSEFSDAIDGTFDDDGVLTGVDDSETEILYGVGVDLNIGSHFGVPAEYETYDVSDSLDSISPGAFWRF